MGFGNGLSAGLAGGSPEISGPMEGGTGPAVGVDKNPAARHDLQHLACFFHGQLLLLLREIKTHGGPLRSTNGRLRRASRSQVPAGLHDGAETRSEERRVGKECRSR